MEDLNNFVVKEWKPTDYGSIDLRINLIPSFSYIIQSRIACLLSMSFSIENAPKLIIQSIKSNRSINSQILIRIFFCFNFVGFRSLNSYFFVTHSIQPNTNHSNFRSASSLFERKWNNFLSTLRRFLRTTYSNTSLKSWSIFLKNTRISGI